MMKSSNVGLLSYFASHACHSALVGWARKWIPCVLLLAAISYPSDGLSAIVSFDTSSWDHGSGPQGSWGDGEFTGSTTVFGSNVLAISTSPIGTAAFTSDHFARINESFFTGFAFQLDPSSSVNTTVFSNFARIDFTFDEGVNLDSFTLTDVDRANNSWYDVIAAEGFSTSAPGAFGTGVEADYAFETVTNLTTTDVFGLLGVIPVASTGNVQNTPNSDVTFSFSQGVRSFSIYYSNQNATDDQAATQTIGIRGNQFEISPRPIPETRAALNLLLGLICVLFMFRASARH